MWVHKKWFFVARIDSLLQKLISCDKNWFLVTRIDFLWKELISCHKKQSFSWTIKIYKIIHKIRFSKVQLARESCYLGRNIGQGSKVPTKRNIFLPPWFYPGFKNWRKLRFCNCTSFRLKNWNTRRWNVDICADIICYRNNCHLS